jgi:ribonuclease R
MPLPLDRDAVLAAFKDSPHQPLKVKDVGVFLELGPEHKAALRAMLHVLVDEGDLVDVPGRRFALATQGLVKDGTVRLNARGFGWFIPDDAQGDGFLPPQALSGLLDGDRVRARLEPSPKGPVAEVLKVLDRSRKVIVGVLQRTGSSAWVETPKSVLTTPVMIPPGDAGGADRIDAGTVVEVVLTQYPTPVTSAIGHVARVIGRAGDLSVEIDRILTDGNIPRPFSPETLAQASTFPAAPSEPDKVGREDLRDIALSTIDGETARDFDDAVYGRREGKDLVVLVAIADVSHYVTPGSALDEDAIIRGTSVYYPGAVVPMLPEALSNGLCSLNPDVDRLCMCAEIVLSPAGAVKKTRFFEGLMKSHARLTYTLVGKWLEGDMAAKRDIPAPVQTSLEVLTEAAALLRKARQKRGSMDFELPETVFETDDEGQPVRVVPLQRNRAHLLIEDLMLAANEAVATRFFSKEIPSIYRIHEAPNPDKVERFLKLARLLTGESSPRPEKGAKEGKPQAVPTAKEIREILRPLHDSPLRRVLDFLLLRAMMQARYSAENVGHYSLASEAYTHFTSPIRRYPDLVVHRLLKELIHHPRQRLGDEQKESRFLALDETAVRCSQAERRATEVERAIDSLMGAWMMRDKVGEELVGTVSGCAEFGAFVRLDEPYVEGMVHVATIADEYLEYDELRMRLYGRRTGFQIGVGDRVTVSVDAVDVTKRQVGLRLLHIHEQHGAIVDVTPASAAKPEGGLPGFQAMRQKHYRGKGKGEGEWGLQGGRKGDGGRKKGPKGGRRQKR